jgi:DNA-binding NtrC family response regulator
MPPTRHILIADDDRNLRESLGEVLSSFGWQTTVVGCGHQAITELSHTRFDLLLSDVDMPDMTGFQLLGWLRDHQHHEPTLLMSARATAELGREAQRLGALRLLAKPMQMAELNSIVTSIFT